MKIEITRWDTNKVIFALMCKNNSLRKTLEVGVKEKVNFYRAQLNDAQLNDAQLNRAQLNETILDPNAEANADVDGFEIKDGLAIGYRTRKSGDIGDYLDGRVYSADFFSVCETECHPGRYLWPTLEAAKSWDSTAEIIKVKAPVEHIHRAGLKWRCRWFEVIGTADGEEK